MLALIDPVEMTERLNDSDHAVTAHPQITHVVEEDDAGGMARVSGLAKQGTHQHVVPTRLGHDRHSEVIKILRELFATFL